MRFLLCNCLTVADVKIHESAMPLNQIFAKFLWIGDKRIKREENQLPFSPKSQKVGEKSRKRSHVLRQRLM